MVEASKLWFERTCSGCECNDLIHPWTYTCSDATRSMLFSCIKGSYKFYAVVYLVSSLNFTIPCNYFVFILVYAFSLNLIRLI